jgi:hypothetical protein
MTIIKFRTQTRAAIFMLGLVAGMAGAKAPVEEATMLRGEWVPENPHDLDFAALPLVPSQRAVVSDVRGKMRPASAIDPSQGGVNQHNYLTHFEGQYWVMWSDGPKVEDCVGQIVKYATSKDGLNWTEPHPLTPDPPGSGPDSPHYGKRTGKGFRYIARGFWQRDGELIGLASLDEAGGFFGPALELRAFRYDGKSKEWKDAGVVAKDAINNFPPMKIPNGQWMMSKRAHDYGVSGVHFLVGGTRSINEWKSFPVLGSASELMAEEPDWWVLPDKSLVAIFRDNKRSGFLYRSYSRDGRKWTKPVKTNFPDATSKICGLRLSDGRYAFVSNPNPKRRDPLTLSISSDGKIFTKMMNLVSGRHADYPHLIEHEGRLLIAFSGAKQMVEVFTVKLSDIDAIRMPTKPLTANAESP